MLKDWFRGSATVGFSEGATVSVSFSDIREVCMLNVICPSTDGVVSWLSFTDSSRGSGLAGILSTHTLQMNVNSHPFHTASLYLSMEIPNKRKDRLTKFVWENSFPLLFKICQIWWKMRQIYLKNTYLLYFRGRGKNDIFTLI